jgi:PAS domain S-box-containing protein
MIGYTYREVVGKKSWSDFIIPEQKPIFEEHWKNLCRYGKVLNLYYTLVHKDGHYLQVLLNATAKLDDKGRLVYTRGSVLDVTEKEAARQVLEQKNAALREILAHIEIEKNRVKDQVMANVQKLIIPVLTKLRRQGTALDRQHISLLESNLKEITSGFGRAIGDHRWKLTPREVEICDMIKKGLSTKEMASLMNSSSRTVENQRNRIRKKLEISQKDVNLTVYLQTLERKSS